MPGGLPVIYVRGFGGMTSGINKVVDDPFYGFNLGSTHVRVGAAGDPVLYQFEGPLLRLMLDEGYRLEVHGKDYQEHVPGTQHEFLESRASGDVSPETIWVHRFYDEAASTFGAAPERFDVEQAAVDLLKLIEMVQHKTAADRVHLVAHSMGGLICRSLIQKVIPDRYGSADPPKRAKDFIDKLFTYATPHGGIAFDAGGGLLEELRDVLTVAGADIFGPERMYQYLTPASDQLTGPPPEWTAQEALVETDNFGLDQLFCLIGTDAEDYDAVFGASTRAVGVKSDGLVQIENAYVPNANHAYVHRSHSGRYGVVNSEEGYQNLRRFLFGDLKVVLELANLRLPGRAGDDIVWQAEVQCAIRGLPSLLHEQSAAHHCPIPLRPASSDPALHPTPLITSFLKTQLAAGDTARYAVHLRILSLRERGGVFGFFDHVEQTADFDDTLILDLKHQTRLDVWAAWNSQLTVPLRDYEPSGEPIADQDERRGVWTATIRLPGALFGPDAGLALTATAR